ncbi:MAG: 1-aminocyclopropane-1-carboxylate deaminase/D-cysteine desulfhydrase [Bacteroidia bacterium]|nr:1-aminocyclopropane-1-carboxylate deaminase/D-cysteine desulfhydrase [Bacteroidia bacterium]
MTSFLTEAFDIKVQNLLKKIKYKNSSFYVLCLHQSSSLITGNKAWKLKYNIEEVIRRGMNGVLTFGGTYSNHIYQTARFCNAAGLASVGIIRGEILDNNPTMLAAKTNGMKLIPLSRSDYKKRFDPEYLEFLQTQFPSLKLLPEGGTNKLAIQGTTELGNQIGQLCREHIIANVGVSVGTGGTIAGIICGLKNEVYTCGFGALKGDFLLDDARKLVNNETLVRWGVEDDQAFGGYAKWNMDLIQFIQEFYTETNILLDPIYTGKMMFNAYHSDRLDESWMFIHTGGIQGNLGFRKRFGVDLPITE